LCCTCTFHVEFYIILIILDGPSGPEAQEGPSHIVIVERENSYGMLGNKNIVLAWSWNFYSVKILKSFIIYYL